VQVKQIANIITFNHLIVTMRLRGSQFSLRTWQITDAASLQKHADNVNISQYLFDRFPYPYQLSDAEQFISIRLGQDPVVNFAIEINGEVAGGIGLEFRQDVYRKTPLLGYWLSEQYWGKGIMPEAVKLIADYAFDNLDVICIVATTFGNNPKSMRVLEKAGFIRQGIIKQSAVKYNEVFDEHVFALHRN
jgi:ribosomal-protein-alanine N-acetyltransferase